MMRSDLALAALASAAVPGMKPVAVAGIGPADDDSPEEHQLAMVEDTTGRRWLVRAPLTPVAGARLQQHDELVRQLSRHVPFKVPAPVGYADVGRDGRAAVYPFVEGSPVDLRRLPAGPGLASALARAVAAVHNIPRVAFEEQDVPVMDAAGCRQRLIAEVDRAAETGRVPTGLLARWEEAFDAAPLWQFATTPVHGRFRGSTVLVTFGDDDAASGRVVAVTGWEEAGVLDPAVDLAELCAQASPQAWESVLESYTLARAQRPDPYLHVRARLHAEVRALRGLAAAVAEERDEDVRRTEESLRRMDRLTEDDDALVPMTARRAAADGMPRAGTALATPGTDGAAGLLDTPGPGTSTEPPGVEAPQEPAAPATPEEPVLDDAPDIPPADVDDDATMEVPVPRQTLADLGEGSTEVGEEAATSDEPADDGPDADAWNEPPAGPGPEEADDERSGDVLEGHGHEQPVEPVGTRRPQLSDAESGPRPGPEDGLDDEHRLAELYGMPAEDAAEADGEGQADGQGAAGGEGEAEERKSEQRPEVRPTDGSTTPSPGRE
nr:phosphotransferase [Ornithinimicrobium sp. CNJ-824]